MKSRTIHRKRLLRVVLWTLVLCFNCIVAEETGERQPDYFEATEANEYDDRTLLDTFGQAAKEFLTKRVIPDTDADCKWDWRYVRCEPYCQCDFTFKRGDYHLGRSCRRRLHQDETCDTMVPPAPTNGPRLVAQRVVEGTRNLVRTVIHKTKASYRTVEERVCDQLPDNLTCPDDEESAETIPLLAWQEKLLCRNQIPDCLMKMQRPKPDSHIPREEV